MKILKFIFRIITLPLIVALWIIARIRDCIIISYCYLRYGGEFLTFNKEVNPKTIYEMLNEKKND